MFTPSFNRALRSLFLILRLGCSGLLVACSSNLEQATEFKNNYEKILGNNFNPNEPGVVVAIYEKGQLSFSQSIGMANVDKKILLTQDMQFRIGSLTKQFTAAAIMLLQEQGKLSVKDKINKHLHSPQKHWDEITIEHLLTHSSGMGSYLGRIDKEKWNSKIPTSDIFSLIKALPLQFTPGSKMRYSNSGYFLLGMIIENLSRKHYADFMQDEIFTKLNMKNSYVCDCADNKQGDVVGYNHLSFNSSLSFSGSAAFAAGAITSTTKDLGIWSQAISENKLLTKESWQTIFTPYTLRDNTQTKYGYGWGVSKMNEHIIAMHNGALPGFKSYIARVPEKEITIIMFTNRCDSYLGYIDLIMYSLFNPKYNQKVDSVFNTLLNEATKNELTNRSLSRITN